MKKLWLVLIGLLVICSLFVACKGGQNEEQTNVASTDDSTSDMPTDTLTDTEPTPAVETEPPAPIETVPEPETVLGEEMAEADVKQALENAFETLSKKQNVTHNGSITVGVIANGQSVIQSFESSISKEASNKSATIDMGEGLGKVTYSLIGTTCYAQAGDQFFKISLNDAQALFLDTSVMTSELSTLSADSFSGLAGYRRADGSIGIVCADVSGEVKDIISSYASELASMGLKETRAIYFLEINKYGIPSSLSLYSNGNIKAEGVEIDITISIKFDILTNVARIAPPDNESKYQEADFNEMFPQYVPFVLGINPEFTEHILAYDNQVVLKLQDEYLKSHAMEYAGHVFTLRGKVSSSDGKYFMNYGDVSIEVSFEGVSAPSADKEIIALAAISPVADSDGNVTGYTMVIADLTDKIEDKEYTKDSTKSVVVKSSKAYLYMYDNESSACVCVPEGTFLSRIAYNDDWYIVVYDEEEYYIKASDVDIVEGQPLYILADSLNVRSEPVFSGNNIVGVVHNGDVVIAVERTSSYNKIIFENGPDGFAYISANSKYVTDVKPN